MTNITKTVSWRQGVTISDMSLSLILRILNPNNTPHNKPRFCKLRSSVEGVSPNVNPSMTFHFSLLTAFPPFAESRHDSATVTVTYGRSLIFHEDPSIISARSLSSHGTSLKLPKEIPRFMGKKEICCVVKCRQSRGWRTFQFSK